MRHRRFMGAVRCSRLAPPRRLRFPPTDADLTGMMGYCCSDRCPNTAHAWQVGCWWQQDKATPERGSSMQAFLAARVCQ